ncbi:MAG: hypothetical protein H6601_11765 [Flavobacteriales bacterium]|nr:hypothetical protein [Flavobacteriales bacterium]
MNAKNLLNVACIVGATTVSAQERVGLANSNYAGTTGMPLNPSSMVDSKAWLDINLVGADVFAWNNFVYLGKKDFYVWDDVFSGNIPTSLYRTNGKEKHAAGNIRIDGPSFTLSQGKNAFGFHTAARTFISAEDLTEPTALFIREGLDYNPQRNISYDQQKMGAYATAWAEIGLSYGRIVYQRGRNMINVGITAKYLMGIGHMSLYLDDINHQVVSDEDWDIANVTGQYAMTEPGFANGHGFGVDLGFTYKRMLEEVDDYKPHTAQSDCGTIDYRYRIGVSLLDLGGINFNKNSLIRKFNNSTFTWNDYPNADVNSMSDIDALIASQFASDAGSMTSGSRYGTSLPSAVSVQFDYNLGKNFYANATWVQGFKIGKRTTGIRRSLLAITPRYEHKWFEASLPISLYDYRSPQVGLALRFYSITIGSDNLLPFIIPMNIYSANIYASVKITLFKNPFCGKSRAGKKSKKNGRLKPGSAVDCPAFM